MTNRTIASSTMAAMYGQSGSALPSVGAIESSIAWRTTIGIASESPV